MSRLRLAVFTPLNPLKSGISDYSEELLPRLGDMADLEIVTGPYKPTNESIRRRFEIIQTDEFLRRRSRYDSVVYQVGNSLPFHGYMVPCMRQVPGVVVLHDYSLSYLVLGLTLLRGDYTSLHRILEQHYPERAGNLARRLLFSLQDPYELSLAAPIVEMSRGIIVHNEFAAGWLRREFPRKEMRLIPHGVAIQEEAVPSAAARARYGLKQDDLILASVSTLAYNKRLGTVLNCLPALRQWHPNLKLLIVSGGIMGSDLRSKISSLGLEDIVIQTGWVPWEQYRELIRASDIVVNLRYPTAGETSGSALRAMEAGRPLIVSDHGSFREIPADCALRIPVDDTEEAGFLKAAHKLLSDTARRSAMGDASRRYVCRHLRLEDAASAYIDFIRTAAALPADSGLLPDVSSGLPRRLFYSATYKSFRLRYVYRHYGIGNVWERLTRELRNARWH